MSTNAKGYCTGGRTVVDGPDRVACGVCGVVRKPKTEDRNGQLVYVFRTHRPGRSAPETPEPTKLDALDQEAALLIEAGASGQEFEMLHRRGWRPPSQRKGPGLDPCPSDCGVCNPVLSPVRRRKR